MLTSQILDAIDYFSRFQYAPDVNQIQTFIKAKVARQEVEAVLGRLVRQKKLVQMRRNLSFIDTDYYKSLNFLPDVYTRWEYGNKLKTQSRHGGTKLKTSVKKLEKVKEYIKALSFFPQVKLVGISGSVAMMNAQEEDDIDLFIITQRDRLWTGRIIAVILAELLRKRRRYGDKQARDKICLNLFFDEKDLTIPAVKRSEYVAHEVLQMKPVVIKGDIYERFLDTNKWVFDIFPNARKFEIRNLKFEKLPKQNNLDFKIRNLILKVSSMFYVPCSILELILKKIQLRSINRHRTSELITDSQLWFFPDDFEKKMK